MPRAKKPPAAIVEPFGGRPQPAKTATGLPYGEHQALIQAQQAIPLPGGGAPDPSAAPPPSPAGAPGPPPAPGAPAPQPTDPTAAMNALVPPTPLSAPTQRPGEPVTTGLAPGPAPVPYADGLAGAPSDPGAWLRAVYSQAPSNDLLDLITNAAARAAQPSGA